MLVAAELVEYPLLVRVSDTCLHCGLHEPLIPCSWGADREWCNLYRYAELVDLFPDGLKPSSRDPFPISHI